MDNGALRVLGCSYRVADFLPDKIISYYCYGGKEAEGMKAFFRGENHYENIFSKAKEKVYFDTIRCEYDLNNKTYKIYLTIQGIEKEVVFEGDDVNRITGVLSSAHGFYVKVDGKYVDVSNDVKIINQNFKDKNLNITAKFIKIDQNVGIDDIKKNYNTSLDK